jgi:hypothetical protein
MVRRLLEAIYEPVFIDTSYGFRPRRSCHDALRRLNHEVMSEPVNWLLDMDLAKCFGAPGQAWRFQRVRFPPRQGERAAPPGIESWAHGGNDRG